MKNKDFYAEYFDGMDSLCDIMGRMRHVNCTSYESCKECIFDWLDWLEEEYVEPNKEYEIDWDRVPEGTPLSVWWDDTDEPVTRYFREYDNERKMIQCLNNKHLDDKTVQKGGFNMIYSMWQHGMPYYEDDLQKYRKQ